MMVTVISTCGYEGRAEIGIDSALSVFLITKKWFKFQRSELLPI